jgi:hypothetical protein
VDTVPGRSKQQGISHPRSETDFAGKNFENRSASKICMEYSAAYFVNSKRLILSNPASHFLENSFKCYDRICEYFFNACKKTLAFTNRLGVASASVQGLRISLLSFDGERGRDFQKAW